MERSKRIKKLIPFWKTKSRRINQLIDLLEEDKKMYHDVTIQKVSNGFIVKVGCMTIVSTSWKEVTNGLEKYWKDPKKAETEFRKKNGLSVPYTSGVVNHLLDAETAPVLPQRRGSQMS